MSPLRVVFLGSDPIALPLLEWMASDGSARSQVVGVFTQPDRPAGRGQKIAPNAIKAWALARGLPVHQPERISEESRAILADMRADVALVMAFGHLLRDAFIATPRLGTLNLHTSILPKYRGGSPIQTAVASGERETGVSLMRIVRQLDAGPVADVERVAIDPRDTALEVEAKLAEASRVLLARAWPRLSDDNLSFTEQDAANATYCRRLEKSDGALDFHASASVLAARINGLHPWPGCRVAMNGQVVGIGLADVVSGAAGEPGAILGADSGGLLVSTGNGILRFLKLQKSGGRMLAAPEFLRGFPIAPGTRLVSHPMPALVAKVPFRPGL